MCPSDDVPDDHDHDHDHDPEADLSPAARAAAKARAATARLVRELPLHDGPVLPSLSTARLLALGKAAVEPLINLMVDSRLRAPRGPAGGWAPVHAAKLLGQLDPEAAVEPLLDVLATTAQLSPLRQAVEKALAPLGAPLVSPILARLPTAVGGYRRELWFLLANAGVRDTRIFVQLLGALAESPEDGAMYLAEYGDKAALPELSRSLDAHRLEPEGDTPGDHTVFELREAIHELGGELTPAQQAKYERALWARRIEVSARTRLQRQPVRPDTPCRCGSGLPYKSCCLQ